MKTAITLLMMTSRVAMAAPDEKTLKAMAAKFAPVELTVDLTALPESERQALAKLVEAARIMDALYLRQVWAGNENMLLQLLEDKTPLGRARLELFLINKGPWDRLDHNKPFIPGAPEKPPGANFYPAGARKEDIEAWIKKLPPAERTRATGFFSVIRRNTNGELSVIPYSTEYQNELMGLVAPLFLEAGALTKDPSLLKYLGMRLADFARNDYYQGDVAWMELDSAIEPTIGPYEVYEDEWFNYKAAFEAFIGVRDDAETKKLAKFSSELQDIENHLPIDDKLKNPKLGAMAPIRVINQVYCAGDANHGVQTAAFNLPNDERVTNQMGSKRVMLKNVQEAKFKKVLMPIAQRVLAPADLKNVSFDSFFTHILMHELMHGLGPHTITVGGKETTVRQSLQETSSAFEEAKADISGLWALQYLVDKGVLQKSFEQTMYTTFLAGAFRTLRFGISEAHGKGMAMQVSFLLDEGGFKVDKNGRFTIDTGRIKPAVAKLVTELMTIQAAGDRARAKAMLDKLAVVRPQVQAAIDKLREVPVDIAPKFLSAQKLR